MPRGVVAVALLIAAFFVVGGAAAAGGVPAHQHLAKPTGALAPSRVASTTFVDPTGDAGAAPDITNVTVSNTDDGLITFSITVANRTALGPDDAIAVPLATDDPDLTKGRRNDGVNYIVGLEATGPFLLEWNGSAMVDVKPVPASLSGSFSGGVATLTVRQEDLAPGFPDMSVPISMNFYVLGILFNANEVAAQDDAPDGTAVWTYRIIEAMRLIITSFDADKTIKAGKTVVALLAAAHGDTGAALSSGKVTCTGRLGAKGLKGTGKFFSLQVKVGGQVLESPSAACSWKIPKTAGKKTLSGSIAVTESGLTVSRSFTTKVR